MRLPERGRLGEAGRGARANLAAHQRGRREMNHLKRAGLVVALSVAAGSAEAQLGMFSKEQRAAITSEWTGERFPDGRPKVPDTVARADEGGHGRGGLGRPHRGGLQAAVRGRLEGDQRRGAGAPAGRARGDRGVHAPSARPQRGDQQGRRRRGSRGEGPELLGDRHPPAGRRARGRPLRQDRQGHVHRRQPRHVHLRQDRQGRRGGRLGARRLGDPGDRRASTASCATSTRPRSPTRPSSASTCRSGSAA